MSKSSHILSNDDIEEELLNNDLLSSGTIENDGILNKMNMEDKRDLLRRISQSKEFQNESGSSQLEHSALENSTSNFPSLPGTGKNNSEKKLRLPRAQISASSKTSDSEDSRSDVMNTKFNLPNCLDDGALPLPLPDRPRRYLRIPYCVMKGENPNAAYRRMLADHEKWKSAYIAEMNKIEAIALGKDLEESDCKEQRQSPKHAEEDNKNDPFYFDVNSSPQIIKSYSVRKREPNVSSNEVATPNSRKPRTIQRKSSRDSDCEEVETILKPAEPNLGEWIQATSSKTKRNRKRTNNQEKGRPKSVDEVTEVEFEFDNKWEGQSSVWQRPQSPNLTSPSIEYRTRRNLSNVTETRELMVECPICQRRFTQSKVENHAATCEGFSDSPMEIEEN